MWKASRAWATKIPILRTIKIPVITVSTVGTSPNPSMKGRAPCTVKMIRRAAEGFRLPDEFRQLSQSAKPLPGKSALLSSVSAISSHQRRSASKMLGANAAMIPKMTAWIVVIGAGCFASLTFAFPHALRASRCQYGVEWLREELDRRRLRFVPIDGVDQAGRGQESAGPYAIESRTNIQIGWIMPASQIRERLRRWLIPPALAAQLAPIAVEPGWKPPQRGWMDQIPARRGVDLISSR